MFVNLDIGFVLSTTNMFSGSTSEMILIEGVAAIAIADIVLLVAI